MNIIYHRRNTLEELNTTPSKYGIEVDIRSYGSDLIVHHDPFTCGPRFADWIKHFHHRTLILNVKEEGLETAILTHIHQYNIEDYFFLDQSFPFLLKTVRNGERRCAVRLSEFESIHTVLAVSKMLMWVWIDCFSRFPLTGKEARQLHAAGLRLCLVSPELEGHSPEEGIPTLHAFLKKEKIVPEAVCTKRPDLWEQQLRTSRDT